MTINKSILSLDNEEIAQRQGLAKQENKQKNE